MLIQEFFSKCKRPLIISLGLMLQYLYAFIFKGIIYFLYLLILGMIILAGEYYSVQLVNFIVTLTKVKSISLLSLIGFYPSITKINEHSLRNLCKDLNYFSSINQGKNYIIIIVLLMLVFCIILLITYLLTNKIINRYFNKTLPKYIFNSKELNITKSFLSLYTCLNIGYEFLNGGSLFILCLIMLYTLFKYDALKISKEIYYFFAGVGILLLMSSYFLSSIAICCLSYVLITSLVFVVMFFRSYDFIYHIINIYKREK